MLEDNDLCFRYFLILSNVNDVPSKIVITLSSLVIIRHVVLLIKMLFLSKIRCSTPHKFELLSKDVIHV